MDKSINQSLTQFLGRWNINCYKDDENNFYIKHDGFSNYLGGQFIKCEDINDIINALPDLLLENDMNDIKYNLGSLIRLSCRIDINTSDAEIMTEKLEEVYKTGNDTLKLAIKPQLEIMKAWTDAENVLIDNVEDTCLTIAVIKAIENGTIHLEPSLKENTITANINNQELKFNEQKASSWEEFKEAMDNASNDYETYDVNEAAQDIATVLDDMLIYDAPNEAIEYLTNMKKNLPDYYNEIIDEYIEKGKENDKYEEPDEINFDDLTEEDWNWLR